VHELIVPAFNLGPSAAHPEVLDRFFAEVASAVR
jgi:hypothetical protein